MKLQFALNSAVLSFLAFILSCHNVNAKLAPDFIIPCNDTSRECLLKSTQAAIPGFAKGLPDLGVPVLDPFYIKKVSIPLNGIDISFYNGKASGFSTCIVDDIASLLEKRKFMMEFHCNLTIKGNYAANGQLFFLPIDGYGNAVIKLTNMRMKIDINSEYKLDKNNLHHFSFKNYNYTFDYGDRVTFDIENIFQQSKQLSDTVNDFMNKNWKLVTSEFGKSIVDYATALAVKAIAKFFVAVPCEELINVPIPDYKP